MGLDVRLYHRTDPEADPITQFNQGTEAIHQLENDMFPDEDDVSWEDAPEEYLDEYREKVPEVRERFGLDDLNFPRCLEEVKHDSESYPDHMFKVGYWRSSYNDSGLNSVLRRMIGDDLYSVIVYEGGTLLAPDWEEALTQIRRLREKFEEAVETKGQFDVMEVSYNPYKNIQDESVTNKGKALDLYLEEIQHKAANPFPAYSNSSGSFFREPLKVVGLIEGTASGLGPVRPAVYVVFERDSEAIEWYVQALEIVEETILWVTQQPDPENYFLSWSG